MTTDKTGVLDAGFPDRTEAGYRSRHQRHLDEGGWTCSVCDVLALLDAERDRIAVALVVEPEAFPEPIGRVRRRWWRLGWLSAQAVARAALGEQP